MFWAPYMTSKYLHILPAVFSSSIWKRGGVWMCKLDEVSNANNDNMDVGCTLDLG